MSEADKLFEELGYEKDKNTNNCYVNVLNSFKKQKDIEFDDVAKNYVTIRLSKYNEYGNLEINQIVLSLQELKAINLKCKELGWIE